MLANVDEKKLGALRSALNEVSEPELEYDKNYIIDAMKWNVPTKKAAQPEQISGRLFPPPLSRFNCSILLYDMFSCRIAASRSTCLSQAFLRKTYNYFPMSHSEHVLILFTVL